MGTPDYLISAACSLVLAQRLARKTCKDCRVPDDLVNPKVLTQAGFTPEQASRAKVTKGKGCPKCKNSGYKGRMGVYEILNITKPIKEAILRKSKLLKNHNQNLLMKRKLLLRKQKLKQKKL